MDHEDHKREAFPVEDLSRYAKALDPHARLMFLMLAYSGVRVSALCNLKHEDIRDDRIRLDEKGGVEREVILEELLRGLVDEAAAMNTEKGFRSAYVFLNRKGNKWNKDSFRRNTKRSWDKSDLPHRTPHQLRHMFATLAGEKFGADMVRAGLGHLCRETSERYVHPDVKMADKVGRTVRQEIVTHMAHIFGKSRKLVARGGKSKHGPDGVAECPSCGCKFIVANKKARKASSQAG